MKTKTLLLLLSSVFLLLNACSPLTTIVSVSGEQPAPVEVVEVSDSSYQTITIDQVEVEVGDGSPIPVHVVVNGNLPDPCSQVEYTEIKQDGSNFNISLFATPDIGGPAVDGCIKDVLSFTMSIPLNMVDLPAGSYTVTVNGSSANFNLDTDNPTAVLRTADMPIIKEDVQVDAVTMNLGEGSPFPAHAVVSANLSNTCAQLSEVHVIREGFNFFIRLIADVPAEAKCNPDTLPFRLEVPLNIVGLEEGSYTVTVSGANTSFDLPIQ